MRYDAAPFDPAPGLIETDPLTGLLSHLCELSALLPDEALCDAERRRLGGHLLPHGPGLVRAVAAGMQRRPDLFPDVAVSGDDLAERQRQAYRWLTIRDALRALAERAAGTYIKVQGQVVSDALAVVRATAARPAPAGLSAADQVERHGVLVGAYFLVSRYQQRLEADRQRGLDRARRKRRAAEAEQQVRAAFAAQAEVAGPERAWTGVAPGDRGPELAWAGEAPGAGRSAEAPERSAMSAGRSAMSAGRGAKLTGRSARSPGARAAAGAAFDQASAAYLASLGPRIGHATAQPAHTAARSASWPAAPLPRPPLPSPAAYAAALSPAERAALLAALQAAAAPPLERPAAQPAHAAAPDGRRADSLYRVV